MFRVWHLYLELLQSSTASAPKRNIPNSKAFPPHPNTSQSTIYFARPTRATFTLIVIMQPSTMAMSRLAAQRRFMQTASRVTPAKALPRATTAQMTRFFPGVVVVGAVYGVVSYVRSQLRHESSSMDRIFAQQNTPEVEAARKRDLKVETMGDPRKTMLNLLG
ncbi:uncharacterized protein BCR38DRAFT_450810 [Pseudomassariella vexata]|uniref:Uncharacterized protein n=1 Tax=Pseudomassariella vexata TaxID=1141098 RepID=A0A1Y2DBJ8_9PEZI|nr:uncharacterized protein BCR38DRAFT_450810 [Pseudomassariella vexata]ORY56640.1 hypothetical protein BCR38DRAFT_450810 [Pseudomassariella vexata]